MKSLNLTDEHDYFYTLRSLILKKQKVKHVASSAFPEKLGEKRKNAHQIHNAQNFLLLKILSGTQSFAKVHQTDGTQIFCKVKKDNFLTAT